MSPFKSYRSAPRPASEPGPGDDIACHACGARSLDTGLECSECGADNYEAVTGKPFDDPRHQGGQE